MDMNSRLNSLVMELMVLMVLTILVFILEYFQEKLMTKFFKISKNLSAIPPKKCQTDRWTDRQQ